MTERRVLVTGASRGIGAACARALARDGFGVVLNYRSRADAAETLRAAIEAEGGSAALCPFDVSDRAATAAALEREVSERGAFWGVVVNAGVTRDGPFASMRPEDWDDVIGTNLGGFYNVVQPLVMPMVRLRDGGRIVAMSSIAGVHGNRGQANYAASKAGLIAAVKSIAVEVAKRGITVNAIAPGFVATDMVAELPAEIVDAVPLKRMATPEEIGALASFLFSGGASYMTGQVVEIDGGLAV